jgi:SAM-dependent methyltransferase
MMKQNVKPSYRPTLAPDLIQSNLSALVARGTISSQSLDTAIKLLDERFKRYCALYPLGLWAPGLVISGEMRGLTEQYLPMAEIRPAFRKFFSLALHYPLSEETDPVRATSCWLDLLQRLRLPGDAVNPGALLKKLTLDESWRIMFLFAALLPQHHGGSFARYPAQIRFLQEYISGRKDIYSQGIRCLDAACGTGEGSYDLAGVLLRCGIPCRAFQVHGCSLEPLEVFTAAHSHFPQDPDREKQFRTITGPLFACNATERMLFFVDDIMRQPKPEENRYDIILCNGLLGGPFLHGNKILTNAIASVVKRLKSGGVLLAADRFHGGWKKDSPPSLIKEIMERSGLVVRYLSDGIAAEKIGVD